MLYNTCMRSLLSFDFSKPENILTMLIVLAAVIVLIVIFIMFLVLHFSQKKFISDIENASNTLRIYVIDVKNDNVSYFNSSQLTSRKSSSITSFYNQFESREREKLISWVGDLLENKEETPKFLEIKVYIKVKKTHVSSLLQVQKIDYKNQIIYLESRLLKFTNKAHKKGEHHFLVSKDVFARNILSNNGKGSTFCFNFFNKLTKTSEFSRLAYVDIKNILSSFISGTVIMTEHQYGQIIITNFNVNAKVDQFAFIEQIKNKINRFLLIESFADEIDFTVGVIQNQVYFRDVNSLTKNVLALSELAKDEEQTVLFFSDKKAVDDEGSVQHYRTDVETIIQDNKLGYYFQPIFNFDREKVIGYKNTVVPIDSYFKNIDDLKNYALRTEDDKGLFSTIVKNAISKFVQEKDDPSLQLFLPISYNEISYVNRSLGHIPGVENANIVLVLREKDLSNIPEDEGQESFINAARSFKSKGYAIALEIDDDVLTLSPNIYGLFDYFNLTVDSHLQKKNAGSQLPTFQGLIEKLLHYQKPIVATNVPTWDLVELVYKLGVEIVCSDAIALPEQNIMPLARKTLLKIKNLKS